MRRLTPILAGLALGAATTAYAQGGAPPPANMHSTTPPGSASGVSNSVSPGPTLDGRASAGLDATAGILSSRGVGADASTHPPGSVRGTSATAMPEGEDPGMRGSQDTSTYPFCTTRGQDRCRVR